MDGEYPKKGSDVLKQDGVPIKNVTWPQRTETGKLTKNSHGQKRILLMKGEDSLHTGVSTVNTSKPFIQKVKVGLNTDSKVTEILKLKNSLEKEDELLLNEGKSVKNKTDQVEKGGPLCAEKEQMNTLEPHDFGESLLEIDLHVKNKNELFERLEEALQNPLDIPVLTTSERPTEKAAKSLGKVQEFQSEETLLEQECKQLRKGDSSLHKKDKQLKMVNNPLINIMVEHNYTRMCPHNKSSECITKVEQAVVSQENINHYTSNNTFWHACGSQIGAHTPHTFTDTELLLQTKRPMGSCTEYGKVTRILIKSNKCLSECASQSENTTVMIHKVEDVKHLLKEDANAKHAFKKTGENVQQPLKKAENNLKSLKKAENDLKPLKKAENDLKPLKKAENDPKPLKLAENDLNKPLKKAENDLKQLKKAENDLKPLKKAKNGQKQLKKAENGQQSLKIVENVIHSLKKAENVIQPLMKVENIQQPLKKVQNVIHPLKNAGNVIQPLNNAENDKKLLKKADKLIQPSQKAENVLQPLKKAENVQQPLKKAKNAIHSLKKAENDIQLLKKENVELPFKKIKPQKTGNMTKEKIIVLHISMQSDNTAADTLKTVEVNISLSLKQTELQKATSVFKAKTVEEQCDIALVKAAGEPHTKVVMNTAQGLNVTESPNAVYGCKAKTVIPQSGILSLKPIAEASFNIVNTTQAVNISELQKTENEIRERKVQPQFDIPLLKITRKLEKEVKVVHSTKTNETKAKSVLPHVIICIVNTIGELEKKGNAIIIQQIKNTEAQQTTNETEGKSVKSFASQQLKPMEDMHRRTSSLPLQPMAESQNVEKYQKSSSQSLNASQLVKKQDVMSRVDELHKVMTKEPSMTVDPLQKACMPRDRELTLAEKTQSAGPSWKRKLPHCIGKKRIRVVNPVIKSIDVSKKSAESMEKNNRPVMELDKQRNNVVMSLNTDGPLTRAAVTQSIACDSREDVIKLNAPEIGNTRKLEILNGKTFNIKMKTKAKVDTAVFKDKSAMIQEDNGSELVPDGPSMKAFIYLYKKNQLLRKSKKFQKLANKLEIKASKLRQSGGFQINNDELLKTILKYVERKNALTIQSDDLFQEYLIASKKFERISKEGCKLQEALRKTRLLKEVVNTLQKMVKQEINKVRVEGCMATYLDKVWRKRWAVLNTLSHSAALCNESLTKKVDHFDAKSGTIHYEALDIEKQTSCIIRKNTMVMKKMAKLQKKVDKCRKHIYLANAAKLEKWAECYNYLAEVFLIQHHVLQAVFNENNGNSTQQKALDKAQFNYLSWRKTDIHKIADRPLKKQISKRNQQNFLIEPLSISRVKSTKFSAAGRNIEVSTASTRMWSVSSNTKR
ncbi:uncharacterized protein [Procambarus clarkii]|uniref:uncharacterized protein n=1 Tax=Procambarus clarkii TaxID=6728 RepID=UPI00374363D1